MEIIHLTYPLSFSDHFRHSLAIGFFDGVHLGHQAVIRRAKEMAEQFHAVPAVLTFYPHPRTVLGKEKIEKYLTPLTQKLEMLKKLGMQRVFVLHFDFAFAALNKEQFVREVLLPLNTQAVVTGVNFTFGRRAEGKPKDLLQLGENRFQTEVVDPVFIEGEMVSSTRIREALMTGQVDLAHRLLGRPYRIVGEVVHGEKRGRLLGFPTANLSLNGSYLVPRRGVYLVRVFYSHHRLYGLMNIGIRPTFHDQQSELKLEVHLLHHQDDLYGQMLTVDFLSFLREERKFTNIEALKQQIQADCQRVESWLSREKLNATS